MDKTFQMARASIAVLIALAVATTLSLAVMYATPSAAQEGLGCPDGFVPADDGNGCVSQADGAFNDNITTTTSCVQGVLSDDGTQCLVPRLDAAPAPSAPATGTSQTVAGPVQAFTG